MSRTKQFLFATAAWALLLAASACDDGDSINSEATGPQADTIDREVILNSVEDVRAMVEERASNLAPALIEDVRYADGELRVTLGTSQGELDTGGLESACDSISAAVSLTGLRVVVETTDGARSAECEFAA